jgi:hypothetical protein
LPYDVFFTTALVQRSLLIVGLGYLAYLLRWWAAPALIFLSMPTLVAITNLLLTEGLSIPLAVIAAALLIHACGLARRTTPTAAVVLLALAGVTIIALALIKLQFAALLLPMFGAAVLLRREAALSRRTALLVTALPVVVILALSVGQSFENRSETGVFEPVSESARAEWYSAYVSVFSDPANRSDPRLSRFYDEGDLYIFLHGLERTEPDYRVRREVIADRVDAMFRVAGTSRARERTKALIDFFQLGPHNELDAVVRFMRERPAVDLESLNSRNWFARAYGVDAVYNDYNDGRFPRFLSSSALALAIGPDDYRSVRLWILPLTIVVLVLAAVFSRARWLAVGTLLATAIVAVAHAYYFTSAPRYTLSSAAFSIAIACGALPLLSDVTRSALISRRDQRNAAVETQQSNELAGTDDARG